MLMDLAAQGQQTKTVMIDATHLKAHRTAASLRVQKGQRRRARVPDRAHQGGLNFKLHVTADAKGRPIGMFLSAGQRSDYRGAMALLSSLPSAKSLIADRGYDADWFRRALADRGIEPCIPSRKGRKLAIPHAPVLYKRRHRIENMFARLKD